MMTQAEIDALIQRVDSGQYRIEDALRDVAMSAKGVDVRSGIYGAILNAYKDGKAGSGVDAVARAMITSLRDNTPTNDDYAGFALQLAQLRELAHIIDTGNTGVVDVEPSSYSDVQVTFAKPFQKKPRVFATVAGNSTSTNYGLLSVAVPNATITTTGCVIRIYNTHTNLFQPTVSWIAVGETEIVTAYALNEGEGANVAVDPTLSVPGAAADAAATGAAISNVNRRIDGLPTSGGNTYTLPVATASTLGGVMPVAKTSAMTQEVSVDSAGRLYTVPSSSGGGGGTPASIINRLCNILRSCVTTDDNAAEIERLRNDWLDGSPSTPDSPVPSLAVVWSGTVATVYGLANTDTETTGTIMTVGG